MRTLSAVILCIIVITGICLSQDGGSPLTRIEHQTRAEDVCMLVLKDGRFHTERTAAGRAQVFDGTLASSTLTELEPLLNTNGLPE